MLIARFLTLAIEDFYQNTRESTTAGINPDLIKHLIKSTTANAKLVLQKEQSYPDDNG